MKLFLLAFWTVFIADLGDKTQLATVLLIREKNTNKWLVFSASSLALIITSLLGVLVGDVITQVIGEKSIKKYRRNQLYCYGNMDNSKMIKSKNIFLR